VREDVDRMLEAHDMQSGEQREILETFRMFADDRGWIERVREAVARASPPRRRAARLRRRAHALGQSTDPYIRERLSDLQDLTNRCCCADRPRVADPSALPDDMIVIARDMGRPSCSTTIAARLRGVVLEEVGAEPRRDRGARARISRWSGGRPTYCRVSSPAIPLWSTATMPRCWCGRPKTSSRRSTAAIEARVERQRKYAASRDLPSATRDQARIGLHMNAGLLIDMQHLDETGDRRCGSV
jgi:phosphotransferase system enzyme I (PtsP)